LSRQHVSSPSKCPQGLLSVDLVFKLEELVDAASDANRPRSIASLYFKTDSARTETCGHACLVFFNNLISVGQIKKK